MSDEHKINASPPSTLGPDVESNCDHLDPVIYLGDLVMWYVGNWRGG